MALCKYLLLYQPSATTSRTGILHLYFMDILLTGEEVLGMEGKLFSALQGMQHRPWPSRASLVAGGKPCG